MARTNTKKVKSLYTKPGKPAKALVQPRVMSKEPAKNKGKLFVPGSMANLRGNVANIKRFISTPESTTIVPRFTPKIVPNKPIQTGYNRLKTGVKNFGGDMVNTVVGRGIVDPVIDVARLGARTVTGKGITPYNQLKSAPARLGYNMKGYQARPREFVGNTAGSILPAASVYGGGKVFNMGKTAIANTLAGQTTRQLLQRGVTQGAVYGGGYEVVRELADSRATAPRGQYGASAGVAGLYGAVGGAAFGGALTGMGILGGKAFKALKSAYKKLNPKASEKEVVAAVNGYIRNKLGQFAPGADKGKQALTDENLFKASGGNVVDMNRPIKSIANPNRLGQSVNVYADTMQPTTPRAMLRRPIRDALAQSPSPRSYLKQDVGGAVLGAQAGWERDENGKWKYDPQKGAFGAAVGVGASRQYSGRGVKLGLGIEDVSKKNPLAQEAYSRPSNIEGGNSGTLKNVEENRRILRGEISRLRKNLEEAPIMEKTAIRQKLLTTKSKYEDLNTLVRQLKTQTERLANEQGKTTIRVRVQPDLTQEARSVYHGSDMAEVIRREGFKLGGTSSRSVGPASNVDRLGKGVYFADKADDAKMYARSWNTKDVVEAQIKPDVKIKEFADYQSFYNFVNSKNPKAFEKPELLNDMLTKDGYGGMKLGGDTVVYDPSNVMVKGLDDIADPLVAEARKYKSAEEFVKAKPVYYHGTTAENVTELRAGGTKGRMGENTIPGISVTDDVGTANYYASKNGVQMNSPIETRIDGKILKVENLQELKNKLGLNDWSESTRASVPELLSKNGYDGVQIKSGGDIGEIIVTNPKAIKTKSQLTDIYNQATRGVQQAQPRVKIKEQAMPWENQAQVDLKTRNIKQSVFQQAEAKQQVAQKQIQSRGGDSQVSSLEDIVGSATDDVKKKVNVFDYLRTPDRVLNKIGLGNEAKVIRQKYDDYLADLPKEIDKITQWSKQVPPESNQRIFQHLDGQKVQLTPEETKVAGEIQTYLKQWADKLGLPEDRRIASYITHIFEKDFIQKEFDPEIAKLIGDKVPGSVYDPFLEQRLGKMGYVEDTWRALDAYAKRATRKFHMDQALDGLGAKAEKLEESQFDYVKNYIDRINMRPTKVDNLLDNTFKQIFGYRAGQRPTAHFSRMARQAVYRGTLGLNVGSALRNLTQGANTYAELGEKYTLKGYYNLMRNIKSSELDDVGVLRQDLIQDRALSTTKEFVQKADRALFSLFEVAERINRGSAYYGAKARALDSGMNEKEAIEIAKDLVRKTQFTFGSVDTAVGLQSDLAKTLAQLQSFTLKQGEFLGEKISKKEWAGLVRYIGGSLTMVYTVGQLFGMEPKDIIPSFRLGLPPTITGPAEAVKMAVNGEDEYGNELSTADKLKRVGEKFIPYAPAGVQLKKTIQGLSTTVKGYSESKAGRIQYPVDQSPTSMVRAGLFGKYALPEAREYFDSERSVLGEKQSEDFKNSQDKVGNYNEVMTKREEDNAIKQKNVAKKSAIDAFLAGDKEEAKRLQGEYGETITNADVEKRQKEYIKKAIEAHLDGNDGLRKEIMAQYNVTPTNADLERVAKSRAISLFKRYQKTQNEQYLEQAKALSKKYGFIVKNSDID